MSLHDSSTGSVAAHFSIGMTEHHHRHSGVVRSHSEARGHRQDNVRSVVVGLHQSSSASGGAPSFMLRSSQSVLTFDLSSWSACHCSGLEADTHCMWSTFVKQFG
jgi:metal-dependent hydrolase (beta-lactamase superfamily II)